MNERNERERTTQLRKVFQPTAATLAKRTCMCCGMKVKLNPTIGTQYA